jgi:sugar phosphate isomerase/epimerase
VERLNFNVMKIAVTASSLSTDPREVPVLARQLGVDGLLFDAYGPNLSLPDLSQTGRRDFLNLLRSHDRQIVGLRMDLGADGLSPKSDIDRKLSQIERAMDAARGLNATLVCVDLGPLPTPASTEAPKPKVTQDMAGLILLPTAPVVAAPPEPGQTPDDLTFISHLDPVMVEFGRRADRVGVMLAFRSDLSSLAALHRTVAAAACPWFGYDLDPVAVLRDSWDLDETFARFAGQISHVRARDAVRGSGGRTKPAVIGQGSIDWPHLRANLDAAGYHGWLTIDPTDLPDRLTATAAGVKQLSTAV